MPNIKSAKKRLIQSEKRRMRNKSYKSALRTQLKKAEQALESGDKDLAKLEILAACRRLDKVAQKGVIHVNQASRGKSRLMCKLNKIS